MKKRNTTFRYVKPGRLLFQSRARGRFQLLTTLRWLKRRGGTGKNQDFTNDTKLRVIVNDQGFFEKRLSLHAKHTAYWMSVRGTALTGTVLATTEFRDFKCACYNVNPTNHQNKCDGCL